MVIKKRCVFCKSKNIIKRGKRKNKSRTKQTYYCKDCGKRFVLDPIKYIKGDANLVCLAMNEYFKGHSLRDIADTFKQFHNLDISHETLRRWIMRYGKLIDNYTRTLKPQVGRKWHADEQNIKVGKRWFWSWNTMDRKTRFWLANQVTLYRRVVDARGILKKTKLNVKGLPEDLILITDGLLGYRRAARKELNVHKLRKGHATHMANAGIKKKHNNNMIERLHNEFREFDKIRRGFHSKKTAELNLIGMRLYHNFIKPHMALNGLTPAQKANIDLKLGKNRWKDLLLQSLESSGRTY